jgi:hypothetical protein
MWLAEGLQITGALLILTAYLMAQFRNHATDSVTYLSLNLIGAGILAWLAGASHLWGFLLLESVWAVAAAGALAAKARRRRPARAGTSSSPSGPPPASEGGDAPP